MKQVNYSKELEMEKERLNKLIDEAFKNGIPITQDEAVIAQNRKVDVLVAKVQREKEKNKKINKNDKISNLITLQCEALFLFGGDLILEVKINREIRDYTESLYFGLSMRQFIFSVLAVGVAIGIYFVLRNLVGTETVSWMLILINFFCIFSHLSILLGLDVFHLAYGVFQAGSS